MEKKNNTEHVPLRITLELRTRLQAGQAAESNRRKKVIPMNTYLTELIEAGLKIVTRDS